MFVRACNKLLRSLGPQDLLLHLSRCGAPLSRAAPPGTHPLQLGQNPATYMLEVTGGSM